MKIQDYLNDGANEQAQAVLAFLRRFNIEESWNTEYHRYDAEINVARWENCREQGYVVMLVAPKSGNQLNIAFFEHRNSDSICAVKWEQRTVNSPTIDTAEFGDVYKTKFDVSYEVRYGQITRMSEWIETQLSAFWITDASHLNKSASTTAP